MTFDDPFVLGDTDALTERCLVETPVAASSDADGWGVGTGATVTTISLPCMEIPARIYINRDTGFETALPLGLCVCDADNIVTATSRIQYNGRHYLVKELLESRQHTVKRLLLKQDA